MTYVAYKKCIKNIYFFRPRRRSGSSIVVIGGEDSLKARLPDDCISHAEIHHHPDLQSNDPAMIMMMPINQDNGLWFFIILMNIFIKIFFFLNPGPHREMAVDVPESFIARNKTPPRYPPPRPPATTQVIHVVAPTSNNNIAMPQVPKVIIAPTQSTILTNGNGNGGVSLELEPVDIASSNSFHANHSKLSSLDNGSSKSGNTMILSKGPPSSIGSTCELIGFDSMSYRTKSRGSLSTRSSSSGDLSGNGGPPEYSDVGPHRELPVDVPDSFMEVVKAPPRYPPPKPQIVKEVIKKKESISSQGTSSSFEMKQMPQPQTPVRNEVFHSQVHYHAFYQRF